MLGGRTLCEGVDVRFPCVVPFLKRRRAARLPCGSPGIESVGQGGAGGKSVSVSCAIPEYGPGYDRF